MTEYYYNNDELKSKLTTVSSQLKTLADGYRDLTKVENQLSLFDMIGLQKHLSLVKNPNLLTETNRDIVAKPTDSYSAWVNYQIPYELKLNTTYTFSAELTKSDNTGVQANSLIRIFIEGYNNKYVNYEKTEFFIPADGRRYSYTFNTSNPYNYPLSVWIYAGVGGNYNVTQKLIAHYKNMKLEEGDLATPL